MQEGNPGYVNGEQHGIIMAKEILGTDISWGCEGTSIPGATGTGIGTGEANSIAIWTTCADPDNAAVTCYGLVVDGYMDWYLPSHDEWGVIHANYDLIKSSASLPSHGRYLSSTQYSSNEYWAIYVGATDFNLPQTNSKNYGQNVKAVKSFQYLDGRVNPRKHT